MCFQGEAFWASKDSAAGQAFLKSLEDGDAQPTPNPDLWSVIEWESAEAAENGVGFCKMHVGCDVFKGQGKEMRIPGGAGMFALLRRVRKQLQIDAARCLYTPEEDSPFSDEEPVWFELHAVIDRLVSFTDPPTLNPFKAQFAMNVAEGASADPSLTKDTSALPTETSAATAEEPAPERCWFVSPSEQLPLVRGSWKILQCDAALLEELRLQRLDPQKFPGKARSEPLLLVKGLAPALASSSSTAEQDALLCSRFSSFRLTRNEVDGQILVGVKAREDCEEEFLSTKTKRDEGAKAAAGPTGVAVAGVCTSLLQVEKTRGRLEQIHRLLQVGEGGCSSSGSRAVVSAEGLMDKVQASPSEVAAALLGDARLAAVRPFRFKEALEAEQVAVLTLAQQQQTVAAEASVGEAARALLPSLLKLLPPLWGSLPPPTPRVAIFDPFRKGFVGVGEDQLRRWALRVLDVLNLAGAGGGVWLSVKEVFEAVCEAIQTQGLELPGIALPKSDAGFAASAATATAQEAPVYTAEGEASLRLSPALLLQILRTFCDVRHPRVHSVGFPTALGDCAPPLGEAELAVAETDGAVGDGDLVELLAAAESFWTDHRRVLEAKAAPSALKLHQLLACQVMAGGEEAVETQAVQVGLDCEAAESVSFLSVDAFCLALGRRWRGLALRTQRQVALRLAEAEEAVASLSRQLVEEAAGLVSQSRREEAVRELLFSASEEIPLLAMALRERAIRGGVPSLSEQRSLRLCFKGFPELRDDSQRQAFYKTFTAAVRQSSAAASARGPGSEEQREEELQRQVRKVQAAAVSASSGGGAVEALQLLESACNKEEREALRRGCFLSPLRGLLLCCAGAVTRVWQSRLPETTRERLTALFAVKSLWFEEELESFLEGGFRSRQGQGQRQVGPRTLLPSIQRRGLKRQARLLLGCLRVAQDLTELLAGEPQRFCRVQSLILKGDGPQAPVNAFRIRSLPVPFWPLE